MWKWLDNLLLAFEEALKGPVEAPKQPPQQPLAPKPMPTTQTKAEQLYTLAKSLLGKRLTLDSSVPPALGCAEAVSFCLHSLDPVLVPSKGLQGTMALLKWMQNNQQHFTPVTRPSLGTIIVSPTGMGKNPSDHGHTGLVAKEGILSNESQSGLFREQWTLDAWDAYYVKALGFHVFYFDLR